MTDAQKEIVIKEGSVIIKDFFDALAANDMNKLMGMCDTTSEYTFITGGEIYNYQTGKDLINQFFPLVEKQTFETKFEKYIVIDSNCFIYFWKGKNGMYMKSGESTVMDNYLASYTFRKTDGQWKFVTGHESYQEPMPVDTAKVQ